MREYVKRYVDLDGILGRKSVFLIGPRMCGKSMYVKNEVRKHKLRVCLTRTVQNMLHSK